MIDTRIAIVDDHELFAQSIAVCLSTKLQASTRVYTALHTAEAMLPAYAPHLVILDLNISGQSGLGLFRELAPSMPNSRWLVCTGINSAPTIDRASFAGIHGIILKQGTKPELFEAVQAILAGGTFISPTARSLILSSPAWHFAEEDVKTLELIASDLNPKEIAAQRGVSERSVRDNIARIRDKLGVQNNAAAVKVAIKLGILHG